MKEQPPKNNEPVEPVKEKPRKVFTRKERLALMVEKNPAILKMIDRFGLMLEL